MTLTFTKKIFFDSLSEYMASGNPIVTTAYGDLSSYLKDQENAFVIPSILPETIASKIIDTIKSKNNDSSIGKSGKRTAQEYFNPEINTMKIINHIKKLRSVNNSSGSVSR